MIFKKVYIPINALEGKQNFEMWYEDGALFATAESDWASEKSIVNIIGRSGGLIARIKPDHKALEYAIRVDEYTYRLITHTIFKHYFFEGMKWQMYGSISNGNASFVNEDNGKKDCLIRTVDSFRHHGPCYEVKVKDLSKLRSAVSVVLGMMIKEHHKGLSTGENDPKASFIKKFKRNFLEVGVTYEELQKDPDATK
ncbi:MAG: hypothetical protein Q4D06_02135 [Coriobacteriia bacterium]|nr:hypothetical protein [Coriobacteriia bacterium]